ncbi:MAG: DUF72 domain-containing protein [candidate division NC10 bacterium]|nr:DUF72 domain-containing protein [candidate division NC10 bacterium]
MESQGVIKVGCCGFPIAKSEYYRRFPVVEIQQTFYQPPKAETARRWRQGASQEFEFTLKAWQLITHEPSSPTYRRLRNPIPDKEKGNYGSFRSTRQVIDAWARTEEIAEALKAGLIVFQCPPKFTPTPEHKDNLRKFFSSIDRKGYLFAWEPRGKWRPEEVRDLCQELDLIHVVDPLKEESLYGMIRYYRLHGLTGYRYKYTDRDLEILKGKYDPDVPTYFLFNNTFMGEDALRFQEMLKGSLESLINQATV